MEESEMAPLVSPKSIDPFNIEYWSKRWIENRIGWHKRVVHPTLLQHIGEITGQKNLTAEPLSDPDQFEKNKAITWFIPLCGKTLDISYLLSQGFSVFAVEAVRIAIDGIIEEQQIQLDFDEDSEIFTGVNGRLKIYHGDFFSCPLERFGPVDYVWDKGSLIAVEYSLRGKYIETMHKILRNPDGSWCNFIYLLETVKYDKSKFEGPPRSVDDEDIDKLYSSWSNVQMLASEQIVDGHNLLKHVGEDGATTCFYRITPKLITA